MATAEKYFPYFLLRFFHPNKSLSDFQPFAAYLIVSSYFLSMGSLRGILHYLYFFMKLDLKLLKNKFFAR